MLDKLHMHYSALRFATNLKLRINPALYFVLCCGLALTLHALAWSQVLFFFFTKPLLLSYIYNFLSQNTSPNYNLRSKDTYLLTVPSVRTELGKKAFCISAPDTWNYKWSLKCVIWLLSLDLRL